MNRQLATRQSSIPDVRFPQNHADFHQGKSHGLWLASHMQTTLSAMAESRVPQSTLAFHLWKDERFSARKIHPACSLNTSFPRVLQELPMGQRNCCDEKLHAAIHSLANGDLHRIWCSPCSQQIQTHAR